jgi:hypothetical protein
MRTVCCLLAIATFFELQGRAFAQSQQEGPALIYRSPEGCPSEEIFMQKIRGRLAPSRTAAAAGRTLNVQIAAFSGSYSGKLSLVESDGRSTTKSLEARDCEELVDALSLVAALAVESDDEEAPPTVPPTRPAVTPPAAPPSAAPSTPPVPPVMAPEPRSTGAVDRLPADRATAGAILSRTGLEIGGALAVGPAPAPVYGGVLSFLWEALRDGWFRPALQLGGAAAFAPDVSEALGTARFTWLTVRAAAYLVYWRLGRDVVIRAGAMGDVGVLLARGLETLSPANSSRTWASLGLAASLEIPLGSRFAVRPVLAVEAPVRRDRYGFGSTDFFEVPVAIGLGSASIVAYF